MKCLTCGNELTSGDRPNSYQCRQCESAAASGKQQEAGMSETPRTNDAMRNRCRAFSVEVGQ